MKNGWIVTLALLGAPGCWSREEGEIEPSEEERARSSSASSTAASSTAASSTAASSTAASSTAGQARQELLQLAARLRALPPAREAEVRQAAALLADQEPDTHASVTLAAALSQALREDPALSVAGPLAQAHPAIAERLSALNAALDAHAALLDQLSIPVTRALPPAPSADAPPAPETVEAAVLLEKTTEGQWPIHRIFVAYSLELESVRVEAAKLVEGCEAEPPAAGSPAACSAAHADGARALIASIERLSALIDEFASVYC